MDIKAEQKYILLSPSKIRPLAKLVKKMKPAEALEKLPFVAKRASEPIVKVIKSALANARARGLMETDLIFKEIQISEGPRLKRGNPVSRGQWHPIKKRMSHIRVVLTTLKSEIQNPKSLPHGKAGEINLNVQNSKPVDKKDKKGDR
jgi:large subunit ribosomal protein L22